MKHILTTILFFFCALTYAQNISVSDFRLDETDLTANQHGTTVLDQNSEKCALIKIRTTQTGFSFDVGSLGVQRVEQKLGEVWVYVPHGVRKMKVQHAQLGVCEYTFPMTLTKSRTYVMQLITGEVQTVVKKSVTSQYVMFSVTPKNAVVEIDGQMLETADGIASKRMPFGTYNYKVQAPRYSQYTGSVTVNDPKNKHVVDVTLQPQFSIFSFEAPNNAEIWIDDQQKGTGHCTLELEYGTYMVETRLAAHRNTQQEMTLSKQNSGNTIMLKAPIPLYGSLDINSTPGNATVLLDNKQIGTTPMFVDECLIGRHELIIKRDGYKDFSTTVTLGEGETVNTSATLERDFISEGKVFTVNGVSFTMVAVDGGSFTMGATSEMSDSHDDEKPTHQITLSRYYIGETEVTQALWQAVMGKNPSSFKGEQKPVEEVSWVDCQTFIRNLNQVTGKKFRLPTEAEWEFAARGGNKSHHTQYSGSHVINDVAWYTKNSDSSTHPVKQKKANELGIYDMSGNVWEWCQDWYSSYSESSQTNPVGASSGYSRVCRGSSWIDDAGSCRSSYRDYYAPVNRRNNLGLRLALSE